MAEVKDVYGIGDKNALQLRKYYNIRTVNDLKRYVRKMPDIINDVQATGLRYHDQITGKISRAEAEQHIRFIQKHVPGAIACGSYRRGEKKIGDIDILTTRPLHSVIAALDRADYIKSTFAEGDEKFSGVVCLPGTSMYRKIDIMHTTAASKPFAMLYLTGDAVQNILMRKQAKRRKLVLSQHGLKHSSSHKYVEGIRTEKDIFDYLGLEWRDPTERSHGDDINESLKAILNKPKPLRKASRKPSRKPSQKGSRKGSRKGSHKKKH